MLGSTGVDGEVQGREKGCAERCGGGTIWGHPSPGPLASATPSGCRPLAPLCAFINLSTHRHPAFFHPPPPHAPPPSSPSLHHVRTHTGISLYPPPPSHAPPPPFTHSGISLASLDADGQALRQSQETDIRTAFTTAAQYICLAFALQQHKVVS